MPLNPVLLNAMAEAGPSRLAQASPPTSPAREGEDVDTSMSLVSDFEDDEDGLRSNRNDVPTNNLPPIRMRSKPSHMLNRKPGNSSIRKSRQTLARQSSSPVWLTVQKRAAAQMAASHASSSQMRQRYPAAREHASPHSRRASPNLDQRDGWDGVAAASGVNQNRPPLSLLRNGNTRPKMHHGHTSEWQDSTSMPIAGGTSLRRASLGQIRELADLSKMTLEELADVAKAARRNRQAVDANHDQTQARQPVADGTPKAAVPANPALTGNNGIVRPPTDVPAPPPAEPVLVEAAALAPFSLWEYLKEEVLATDFDSTQEMKWERVTNFIAVPWWIEKIVLFGFVVCLDSFLYTFTILPLRFLVACSLWARNALHNLFSPSSSPRRYLHSSHKCDILKTALVVLSCVILSRLTDASKMYHSVRGQDVVKLYVIFNVMEIADRLCCSLGQDLLDALFSRMTLARRKDGSQPIARPLAFFALALLYIQAHTMVLFYQLVTLNVAINSYDNALLTLLLSNQFVEIKGSVFKKFEKENLFQLTCADIVERFQLTLILTAIGVRNLIEVGGSEVFASPSSSPSPLPRSFTVLPSISLLATSFAPVAIVLGSECVVDWLKHAFITKFNHIRPAVYGRFMDVLCRDLVIAGPSLGPTPPGDKSDGSSTQNSRQRRHTYVDQSPIVSRRLGFAALPLACLLVRISAQIWGMLADDSHFDECAAPDDHQTESFTSAGALRLLPALGSGLVRLLMGRIAVREASSWATQTLDSLFQVLAWSLTCLVGWAFLVAVKLLLGAALVSFASYRYRTMAAREAEEDLNARDRHPIGVDRHEREYEAKARAMMDVNEKQSAGAPAANPVHPAPAAPKKPATSSSLMDVDRYSMIKSRLW